MSEEDSRDPQKWIHHPVSDWTDYMDKGLTVYEKDGALFELLTDRKIRDLSPEEIAERQELRKRREEKRRD